jgi:hypothetical protein
MQSEHEKNHKHGDSKSESQIAPKEFSLSFLESVSWHVYMLKSLAQEAKGFPRRFGNLEESRILQLESEADMLIGKAVELEPLVHDLNVQICESTQKLNELWSDLADLADEGAPLIVNDCQSVVEELFDSVVHHGELGHSEYIWSSH